MDLPGGTHGPHSIDGTLLHLPAEIQTKRHAHAAAVRGEKPALRTLAVRKRNGNGHWHRIASLSLLDGRQWERAGILADAWLFCEGLDADKRGCLLARLFAQFPQGVHAAVARQECGLPSVSLRAGPLHFLGAAELGPPEGWLPKLPAEGERPSQPSLDQLRK